VLVKLLVQALALGAGSLQLAKSQSVGLRQRAQLDMLLLSDGNSSMQLASHVSEGRLHGCLEPANLVGRSLP
jgi:hypothetical protein